MSGRSASITRRVEWVDTDASGHYHNSLIMRLVEAAECRLMDEAGALDIYITGAPRVRQEVDYSAPLWFNQEATCEVRLAALGTSSITFDFEVWGEQFEGRPRTLAAHGRVIAVHVDAAGGRSAPWPQEFRAALA